ncbi:hypothetical protein Y032_0570g107 [Ancylostoma ceylanicum]|uniref:Peptidase S1 domain-containing protein n=1 Tax=Ancylostoma ceylanicum TaxID=53326 RepID=A0A016WP15_9BILA|nr:hypothetical protein Y032_0570g107 [Ancylostoma ceylanicum]
MIQHIVYCSVLLLFLVFSLAYCGHLGTITEKENKKLNEICDPEVKKIKKRMLNGQRFDSEQMKYAVMLEIQTTLPSRCAGVIISPRHILTAAHCFITNHECRRGRAGKGMLSSPKTMPVWVHYGGSCVNVAKNGKCPEQKLAKKTKALHIGVPNRYFASKCRSGDIAIVETSERLDKHAKLIEYACIPSKTTKMQKVLTSAGYGYDPNNMSAHEKFLERVWFQKERFCDPTVKAGKDAFCILEKNQFACKGDSGSGVMQPANGQRDYVMGVLSRGLNCDDVRVALMREQNVDREFRGSVMTSSRKYVEFICMHTGICEKHLDRKKLKKERMLPVY